MNSPAMDALEREDKSPESGAEQPVRHLFFKGLAALLLGFPLSLWISWLLMYTGFGPAIAPARDQVSMWLVVPLWCTVLSLSFLVNSRLRCLAWLLGANAMAFGLWWVMQ